MNSIDNVKTGQWLIVTSDREYEQVINQTRQTPLQPLIPRIKYTGIPFKVIAISTPFLLVQTGNSRSVVDTRKIAWTVADQKYVREFAKISLPDGEVPGTRLESPDKSSPPEMICPRCGCQMIERMVEGFNICNLYCNECGGEFI